MDRITIMDHFKIISSHISLPPPPISLPSTNHHSPPIACHLNQPFAGCHRQYGIGAPWRCTNIVHQHAAITTIGSVLQ